MKKSILSITVAALLSATAYSQVQIDRPIQLSGSSGQRSITNLETPVNATDAVNKAYVDAAVAGAGGIPPGVILMWSGTLASIPSGYALCDGTNGTPDLRDKFICGTSTGQNPGGTGGQDSIQLTPAQMPANWPTLTDPGHSHTFTAVVQVGSSSNGYYANPPYLASQTVATSTSQTGITISKGSGAWVSTRPSFYKLAFIMKL